MSIVSMLVVPRPLDAFRRSPAALALGLAAVLSTVWALLPPSGSDLAAQVAHASFFGTDGWLPVDMRWFGGTLVFGYSVLSPPLMTLVGVTAFGVVATVAASGLLGLLLQRHEVPHPRAGALVGAVGFAANLLVGRLTFALGVSLALATLLCLPVRTRTRVPLLAMGTVLTWLASPLAVLFLAMVGVALVLRRMVLEGTVLAVTGGVVLAGSALLGQGGVMPMDATDFARGLIASLVVALVTRFPVVRVVAGLSAVCLLLAYLVATPIGVNALRFPALFAIPVALATSRLRLRVAVPILAGTLLLIPPMSLSDASIGQPSSEPAYFAPLTTELAGLHLTGRVEVVPTADRWEAVWVATHVPLARGWMTQVDAAENGLFFEPDLMTPSRYLGWLHHNAVQYVAVSNSDPAAAGVTEKALIQTHLPYLTRIWSNPDWTLFSVQGAARTVAGATLISQDGRGVAFRSAVAGRVTIRVEYSRWLSLAGPAGCLSPWGRWTQVRVLTPGRYLLSSTLLPQSQSAQCAQLGNH